MIVVKDLQYQLYFPVLLKIKIPAETTVVTTGKQQDMPRDNWKKDYFKAS